MRHLIPLFLAPSLLLADELSENRKALQDGIQQADAIKGVGAAAKLGDIDSKEAVEALCKAAPQCELAIERAGKHRDQAKQAIDRYLDPANQEEWKQRPKQLKLEQEKYAAARTALGEQNAKIANLESIQSAVANALASMRGPAATEELVGRIGSASLDSAIRALIVRSLARSEKAEVQAAIAGLLSKEKDPTVRAALVDAVRLKGSKDKATVELLCRFLKDEYWQVVVAAAQGLRAIKSPDAVDALIEALKSADGRVKAELNGVLVAILGVNKHENAEVWKIWWEKNKEDFLAGTYKPDPNEVGGGPGGTTFYGIPINSKHVVFILDRSGSMAMPAKWKPSDDVITGANAPKDVPKPKGNRKIDIAKYELMRAIAGLPDGAEFSIVFFNQEVQAWGEKLVKLTKESRQKAYEFIDPIEPSGATNISDSTIRGMQFAGPGDKLVKGGCDTIYLLSDGMPTAGIREAGALLQKLKEENAVRKIVIHTVAIEPSPASEQLMQQIAKDHGGTCAVKK